MTDMTKQVQETVAQALAELRDLTRCRCHPAYRDRGLHDPACNCDSTDAVEALAARLAEVEAERDALETAREMLGGFWAKDNARAEAAEAEVARLRTAAGAAGVLLGDDNPGG